MNDWLDKRLIFFTYFLIILYLIRIASGIYLFHSKGMYYPVSGEEKGFFIAFLLLSSFINYRVQKEAFEKAIIRSLLVIVTALGLYYCCIPVIV